MFQPNQLVIKRDVYNLKSIRKGSRGYDKQTNEKELFENGD